MFAVPVTEKFLMTEKITALPSLMLLLMMFVANRSADSFVISPPTQRKSRRIAPTRRRDVFPGSSFLNDGPKSVVTATATPETVASELVTLLLQSDNADSSKKKDVDKDGGATTIETHW